jgi:pyrimidine deaminase RibD-like protein
MKEAIEWAAACSPRGAHIPKVGAILAVDGVAIGRGRRGTGAPGDDNHAEWNAFLDVKDRLLLPKATLYTTLEPCTGDVRSEPLKSCTELILQNKIKKVFIGMLDPNQSVTGKGLWKLQDTGVEVMLFPHELAQQIRVLNIDFIRLQQSWGARIISPQPGQELATYKSEGMFPVRFSCANRPNDHNFLLVMKTGFCWPQRTAFRQMDHNTWEIDAHFGSVGVHELHLVTATDLGVALVEYHRNTLDRNIARKKKITEKFPDSAGLLGEIYPGIPLVALPKGIRSESSVTVIVIPNPDNL